MKSKNIHIIPTDKPTGIFESKNGLHFSIIEKIRYGEFKGFHIYITSDEEIKIGDREIIDNECRKLKFTKDETRIGKKVILTDNKDLIKDGIQAIDDEFLEWFVKHPTCESVEVVNDEYVDLEKDEYVDLYKIIIPQEEPKKEVTGVDDDRTKPNYCYAKEQGHGEIGCVFPACHCGLPIKQEEPKGVIDIPKITEECGFPKEMWKPKQETLEEAFKDFVPYEESLALKKLDFNEPCFACYSHLDHKELWMNRLYRNGVSENIAAPTYSQAFRWFRKKHNLEYQIMKFGNGNYSAVIHLNTQEYLDKISTLHHACVDEVVDCYSYEEAELACLRKLISIVKKKTTLS
jgi:hypothetical protein